MTLRQISSIVVTPRAPGCLTGSDAGASLPCSSEPYLQVLYCPQQLRYESKHMYVLVIERDYRWDEPEIRVEGISVVIWSGSLEV
ncbi:hypothetical protein POX_e07033 [Penicillium oxalicum]|uniref:hypothetical protein n=1 Tax=Penicillium oxalicum TaxID=69781 RepID=UPI0020B72663|nr:hypothetical protein POX_e07033 [Penicillium oxalicum]KAI2789007.1 hypothetical protein POX_e07033 [Penicillium oxalicum]